MEIDWKSVSDKEIEEELHRRKDVLDGMVDLSQVPIEYLISESEKRRVEKEKQLKELEAWSGGESYKILANSIKTPDGTILFSRHRHDFVMHQDSVTGEEYGIDGGGEYLRRIGDVSKCEDLSITDKTPFEEVRKRFHWGSYGKNGDEPLQRRRLLELSDTHIQAIIENVFKNNNASISKTWLEQELSYRKEKNITIADY
jgi:hypothetical protein